jgi:hypothetical protein
MWGCRGIYYIMEFHGPGRTDDTSSVDAYLFNIE